MRHRGFIACLYLIAAYAAVLWPASASPPTVTARFDVDPPEARVWIGGQEVGAARKPLAIDLSAFQGQPDFLVQFVLDGFETGRARVPTDYFSRHNVYPESGEVVLQPEGFWGRVRYHARTLGLRWIPLVAGMLGALFLGGLSWHLLRSSRQTGLDGLPAELGGCRLLERIGVGTCAVVYRGVTGDGQPVAVKVIKDEVSQHPEYRARFEREGRVYRALDHPGIVRLLDWGSWRDRLYLVMEYVGSGTLEEAMRKGPLPVQQAHDVACQVFDAVAYAHGEGVVHRDLKPQNVLIAADGRARVADFGLAASAAFATLTATGRMLGTPAYIAPELIRQGASGREVDPRSDQYSLGILTYELLAGQRPFPMETVEQALWAHLHAAPSSASALRSELPSTLDAVLVRMLAKDPAARYATVDEAKAAMEGALGAAAEEPQEARTPGPLTLEDPRA